MWGAGPRRQAAFRCAALTAQLDQPLRVLSDVAQDLMQRDTVAGTPGI